MPTKIEWTDETWNPVTGCKKVSPGCKHCYAETFAERFRGTRMPDGKLHVFYGGFDPQLRPDRLEHPFAWSTPRMVFVNSMSDLFGEFVPDDYLTRVFDVMRRTPQHTYQVLTKRADRLCAWTSKQPWLLEQRNIWLGVSVEDRKYGLPRVDLLRRATAAVRFLSVEPLLEDLGQLDLTRIDWVIVGGESGHHARPMEPSWVRNVRDQCVAKGVPFFFKQWGGRQKHKTGRILDLRTWDEFPIAHGSGRGLSQTERKLHRRESPSDGLVAQCVGVWAKDKHFYLQKYIDATRQVRAGYLPPQGTGGAAFIDLFAGPGRARVRSPREFIDGSPLIALKYEKVPFSRVILCDIDDENIETLRKRTETYRDRCIIIQGDCNATIDEVLKQVPSFGLNVALIDPFGASALSFKTIETLAARPRMDLIIHFPTGDLKRNFKTNDKKYFESFLGLPEKEWGFKLNTPSDVPKLIGVLRKQLEKLDYPPRELRSPAIKNKSNTVLYNLVYASKHPKGDAIWESITKRLPSGQTSLF